MRMIDAKKLETQTKELFQENPVVMGVLLRWIRKQPTVDAVPIRRGLWIDARDYLKCPKCRAMVKRDFTFFDIGDWNYCPNCGARMDGRDGDGNETPDV